MRAARKFLAAVFLSGSPLMCSALAAAPIAPGAAEQSVSLGDLSLHVFTYRPDCTDPSLLLVFHGNNRRADLYRDIARSLADPLCMIVVAPRFDKRHFPGWRYQRGGIARKDTLRDPRRWTGNIVNELAAWVRREEQRPLPYSLIGHSAGGQFLSRVAAFVPTEAQRIVIANPSSYVLPSLGANAPYGMGGVFPPARAEAELRRYLEQPVTIFLGADDVRSGARNDSPQARAQGRTRLARGRNVFRAGKKLAAARGWTFGWRLIEVPGVGHSAGKMFAAPRATAALAP